MMAVKIDGRENNSIEITSNDSIESLMAYCYRVDERAFTKPWTLK
jgi:hypothetical protein